MPSERSLANSDFNEKLRESFVGASLLDTMGGMMTACYIERRAPAASQQRITCEHAIKDSIDVTVDHISASVRAPGSDGMTLKRRLKRGLEDEGVKDRSSSSQRSKSSAWRRLDSAVEKPHPAASLS